LSPANITTYLLVVGTLEPTCVHGGQDFFDQALAFLGLGRQLCVHLTSAPVFPFSRPEAFKLACSGDAIACPAASGEKQAQWH
jgi:hypothetical protein